MVGGTGVVYGHDGASAFLNPATAVRVDDNRLSFSVNFYQMSFVSAPRWYRPSRVDEARFGRDESPDASLADIEFNALPASICFFFKIADIPWFKGTASKDIRLRAARLGLCFASVQGQTFNFAAESTSDQGPFGVTRQAQTLAQSYGRFSGGPTYAMYITDNLAVGASLHASFASHRGLLSGAASTLGGPGRTISSMLSSAARGDSFQLTATVGATYRYEQQTFGVVVESPSLHIYGVGSANYHTHFEGAGDSTSTTSMRGSFVSRSPTRISIGTGVEKKWGSAELNVSYYAAMSRAYTAELTGTVVRVSGGNATDTETSASISQPTRGVVNIGVGGELYIFPKVSVLGGLATDISAISPGALRPDLLNYFPARNNRYIASLGVGSHGEGGDLLIGSELSVSHGQRLAVNSFELPPNIATTGHTTFQLLFVIAGSTSLKALSRAFRDVREVIKEPEKAREKPPEHEPLTDEHPHIDDARRPSADADRDTGGAGGDGGGAGTNANAAGAAGTSESPVVAPPPPPVPTHPAPQRPKPRPRP